MNEWFELVPAFLLGMMLGVVYFGGLWWTVSRLQRSASPVGLCLISFVIRGGALLGVLFVVLQFGMALLISTLTGLVVVRFVIDTMGGTFAASAVALKESWCE